MKSPTYDINRKWGGTKLKALSLSTTKIAKIAHPCKHYQNRKGGRK